MSINNAEYALPTELLDNINAAIDDWSGGKVARVWKKDADIWTGGEESKWLGWLDIADEELANIASYKAFHDDITAAGFESVLLMGMGGSSLCPEVLSFTFGKTQFHILDSTVPDQVAAVEAKLDLAKTFFIVASKSGSADSFASPPTRSVSSRPGTKKINCT